jgi:hypothetical protein
MNGVLKDHLDLYLYLQVIKKGDVEWPTFAVWDSVRNSGVGLLVIFDT